MASGRSRKRPAPRSAEVPPPADPEESPPSPASDMEPELMDKLAEEAVRGGPRGPGSGGKGRSRLEREQLTNRTVPAGHERKITSKMRASQEKQRRQEQRTGGTRARRPAKVEDAEVPNN